MDYQEKTKEQLIIELTELKLEFNLLKDLYHKNQSYQKNIEFSLTERLKELNCHNHISKIMSNSAFSIDSVVEEIVQIIPDSWQFSEIAKASVKVYDKTFSTPNFKKSECFLVQYIIVNGIIIGQIEVNYPIDQLPKTEQIFLPEETNLLFSIAERLGNFIEKKEKDIALLKSEGKYRNLIENINDVVYEIDNQGIIQYISPSIYKLLGYNVAEIVGKSYSFFVGKNNAFIAQRLVELKEKKEIHYDYSIPNKTGELRWIRFSTKSIIKDGIFEGGFGTLIDITERKLMELELQRSESLYKSILNASPDTITITDLEGKILFSSARALKMFGYNHSEEFQNHSLFEFIDEKDHAKAQQNIMNMFQNILFGADEYTGVKSDGTRFDIEVNGEFIRDTEGTPTSFIFVTRDISDRKLIEEKLRKSEETFRNLVETINDVIYEITNEGTIKYVSPAIERMLGYKPDELIGKNFFNYMYEADKQIILERLSTLTERNYSFLEYRYLTKDGQVCWVRSSTTAIIENGKMVGGTGSFIDITERKQAEDELRKLSQAIEQSPVSIVITNLDGNIEYANPKACQTTGYTLDELVGKNPRVLKSGETMATEYDALWHTIGSGDEWRGIFHNKRKNGELYWESSTIRPIIDANGRITHYLAVKEDITERKKMEYALQESEKRFRQIVEQSQTVIWEVDSVGLYTYVSPLASTVWGYEPTELINKMHFYDIHPKEGREEFKEIAMESFKRKDQFKNFENKIVTGSGKIIWVTTNGIPLTDDQDNLIGYIGADNDITERKLAEEALKHSEEALNYSQEIAKMGSWYVNLITNEVEWSENYYRMLGLVPYEKGISNDYFNNLVYPEDRHLLDKALEKIYKDRKTTSIDLRIIMPDGNLKWVQDNIVPIFEGDTLIALNGVNIDITEKKLSDEKIRQQNDRLNAIISAIPDVFFIYDKEGTYLEYYTPEPEQLLVPDQQVIGTNIKDIFDEESANMHLQKINECLQQKKLVTYDYLIDANSSIRYFESRLVPLDDDQVLTLVRDITEAKIKDNELKKLSLAVEQSPVSIVITDLNADIEYVNPAFITTSGYSLDEIIGKNTNILKSGKTERAIYDDLWDKIKDGKEWHGEWINKKKNGKFYWENISITPIHNANGEITNYLAVKQDISNRKKAEEEIRNLNATLELKIEERTAQLAETNENLLNEIEERKQIEEALQIKTIELENFFNVALDLLCIADISGNFIRVNKAWENILGFSTTELEHKQFMEFVHPDDIQLTLDAMNELSEQNPIINFVNRYRSKDGSYRFIEWHSVPVENLIYAAARDITERKRAEDFEKELLQLSPKLTGIPLSEIDNALNMSLSRIGQFLAADRAYIFELNFSKKTMTNTYEWCNKEINSEIENLKDIPFDILPRWMDFLQQHESIIIPSIEDLPESWNTEREIFELQGIKSLIAIPMFAENNLIGFVGLDAVTEKKEYDTNEINILKVWSSMLASLINNQRSEKLLEQTRQNYETFFNTVDDFLWVLNFKGEIVYTNYTLRKRLGLLDEDLVSKSGLIVYSHEDRDEAISIFSKMQTGVKKNFYLPFITKSGIKIPVETRFKLGNWNGEEVVFGVSKDITQIKLSEQKFATAFQSNSAMMAISFFDEGNYLDINNAFLETLNYTRYEVIGKTNKELALFPDSNLRDNIINDLSRNIPVRKQEILMRTKDGIVKTGLLSADSIFIGENKCLLTVTIDITERKKAEDELREARIEAEHANMAKSEFLSRMSHELRTPMNSILGFAQLLEMGELNNGQKKGVSHILRSGKHLLDLINEVLDIARIEAGRISMSLEPVQLIGVIKEMLDIVQPLAAVRQITLKLIDSPANNLFVNADRQRLKQVLLNLLNNAVKYNQTGGSIIVEIILQPIDTTGNAFLRVSISDTGMGINTEDISKLFKPFERIGAENTETEGTGLGLAVVKKLMDAMGGSIGVESVPRKGSTFWIELPHCESLFETVEKAGGLTGLEPKLANKTGTILYIEDNASNIELVEQVIANQRSGIRLITNMHGRQAMSLAIEYKPDLILLDLNLPDIHGSEVLHLLQSEKKTREIPVIIITADAMPQQLQTLLKSGAKKYMTKPLEIIEFLQIIDEFIKE